MKVFGTDYDGVIINIEPQKAKAFGKLLNKEWGLDEGEVSDFWMKTGGTSRRYKLEYFYEKCFGSKLPEEKYNKIQFEFGQLLRTEFYPKVNLLDGALELLGFAKENFDHTFVSSGMPMEEIKYLVNLNGLSQYFDLILGTNAEFSSKYAHFEKLSLQWHPDKILFLADAEEDMRVAKSFEAFSIGVATNQSREILKNAGATETVDNLSQALSTIKRTI